MTPTKPAGKRSLEQLANEPLTEQEAKLLKWLVEYKLSHNGLGPRAKVTYKAFIYLSATKVNALLARLQIKGWIVLNFGNWVDMRILGEGYNPPAWWYQVTHQNPTNHYPQWATAPSVNSQLAQLARKQIAASKLEEKIK